jgi:hypothetical protein
MAKNSDAISALSAKGLMERDFWRRDDLIALGVGLVRVRGKYTDEFCVKVFVRTKLARKQLSKNRILPGYVTSGEGAKIRVDVEEMEPPWSPPIHSTPSAPLVGFDQAFYLRQSRRPVAGASGSYFLFPAGTISACVRSASGGKRRQFEFILSCNHVFAKFNHAPIGSPIVQPCPIDGGSYPLDTVALLNAYVPLNFGSSSVNRVDAALGRIATASVGSSFVRGWGFLKGVAKAREIRIGERVWRRGRSIEDTSGYIRAVHACVKVNYWALGEPWSSTRFEDQMITDPLGEYGDSGSALINMNGQAVGMLFGGSTTHTLFNYFENVCSALGVEI